MNVDIFCKVIDNYGDIGFCWRLSRDLVNNYFCSVRLIVDNLGTFSHINRDINPELDYQKIENIFIVKWKHDFEISYRKIDLLIETFGCNIPDDYVSKIRNDSFHYINIEYLTAETWTKDFHLKRSKKISGNIQYFFFPGFKKDTGGLILEKDLLSRRDLFQSSEKSQNSFLKSIGINPSLLEYRIDTLFCYIFCYNQAPLKGLLDAFNEINKRVIILVNDNNPIFNILSDNYKKIITVKIPFVNQNDFDKILWSMDINFVRGEDSFIRSIWSGKPFLWNVYPQEEEYHIKKLLSWLNIYEASSLLKKVMLSWNKSDIKIFANNMKKILLEENWNYWKQHAKKQSDIYSKEESLTNRMLKFCTKHKKEDKIK